MNQYSTPLFKLSFLLPLALIFQGCNQTPKHEAISMQVSSDISITTNNSNARRFSIGENLDFNISVKKPLFLHCFYSSKDGIQNFTPKGFYAGKYADKPILPQYPIKIGGGKVGYPLGKDKVACIGSEKAISHKLPKSISNLEMFDTVNYPSMDSIYRVFKNASDSTLVYQSITLRIVDAKSK